MNQDSGVSLDSVLSDLGADLYREDDASFLAKSRNLFTFRKSSLSRPVSSASDSSGGDLAVPSSERKGSQDKDRKGSLFTFRASRHSKSSSLNDSQMSKSESKEDSSESEQTFMLDRLSQHKEAVVRIVHVPSDLNEVWSMDAAGVVNRWSVAPSSAKGGRVTLGQFTASEGKGHAMSVCGKQVWLASGDSTEIRDWKGRLMWKLNVASYGFASHSCENNAVWVGGQNGMVSLYREEKVSLEVQLNYRPAVGHIATATNEQSGETEVWTVQGNVISIIDEASGKLIEDLPCAIESMVQCMISAHGALWMGCADGKVLRWDVGGRKVQATFQTMEGPVSCIFVTPGRLFACGEGRAIRVFELASQQALEPITQAHEEGGINTLLLVEFKGRLHLWSGGKDRAVGVWSINNTEGQGSSNALFRRSVGFGILPIPGRDDSDDFEDSASASASASDVMSQEARKSPRFAPPPNVSINSGPLKHANALSASATPISGSLPVGIHDDDDDEDQVEDIDGGSTLDGGVNSPPKRGSAIKKKSKKRVLPKMIMAVGGGSMEKMQNVMKSVEAKEYEDEGAKIAARQKALDARGPSRRTALHIAAQAGRLDMVEQLLEWGANVGMKDKFDMYPINLAKATDVKMALMARHEALGIDTGLGSSGAKSPRSGKPKHGRSKSLAVSGSPGLRAEMATSGRTRSVKKKLSSTKHARRKDSDDISKGKVVDTANLIKMIDEEKNDGFSDRDRLRVVRIQALVRMKAARSEATQLRNQRQKRRNIGIEMLKTEETYVNTLDTLVNKIRKLMSTSTFRADAGDISDQDMKIIFPQTLNMLLSAHEQFAGDLKKRIDDWSPTQCVGDLFLALSPYLKMYIVYVSNFELSTLKIRELKKREGSRFVELVQEMFISMNDPTNDLASMLVTPVQRIPRYVMLLKDLLKHTSTQHADYNNLLKAVKILTDTTVLVDSKAEQAKNAQKVLECSEMILDAPFKIVKADRAWVKNGNCGLIVSADGKSEPKERMVFLFSDVLILTVPVVDKKKPDQKPTQFKFLKDLQLVAASSVRSIDDTEDMENLFFVKSPGLAFVLQAGSAKDKAAWMKGVVQVIEARKDAAMSRLVSGRGSSSSSQSQSGQQVTPQLLKMKSEADVFKKPESSTSLLDGLRSGSGLEESESYSSK